MEYPSLFVCLMGMGTVFFGLICLIVLTMVMGKIVGGHSRGTQPSGSGGRRLRRHRGGAWHRHHGHPDRIHEKTVRGKRREQHEKVQSHRQRYGL